MFRNLILYPHLFIQFPRDFHETTVYVSMTTGVIPFYLPMLSTEPVVCKVATAFDLAITVYDTIVFA